MSQSPFTDGTGSYVLTSCRATMAVPPAALADAISMNPLTLSDAEYRAVFERITQLALEYLASLDERPSFPSVSGSETLDLFSKPLQENGISIAALNDLKQVIEGAR